MGTDCKKRNKETFRVKEMIYTVVEVTQAGTLVTAHQTVHFNGRIVSYVNYTSLKLT